jgi:hypothetical protein
VLVVVAEATLVDVGVPGAPVEVDVGVPAAPVGVAVGVAVAWPVEVIVPVAVVVGLGPNVDVLVGEPGTEVGVAVGVSPVAVPVGVPVAVSGGSEGVKVGVSVAVADTVPVGVPVGVSVGVAVGRTVASPQPSAQVSPLSKLMSLHPASSQNSAHAIASSKSSAQNPVPGHILHAQHCAAASDAGHSMTAMIASATSHSRPGRA